MFENVLYAINIMLFPALSIFILEFQRRHWGLGIVNPLSLLFVIFFPVEVAKTFLGPLFLLDDGLNNKYYQYSLLMTNVNLLGTLILTAIVLLFLKKHPMLAKIPLRQKSYVLSFNKMKRLEFFFLGISLLLFFIMSNHSYSFIEWLSSPRTGYQLHRVGVGSLYALSLTSLSIAFVIATLRCTSNSRRIVKILVYVFFVYFFGSKGFIISYFIYGVIILWFFQFKSLNFFIGIVGGAVCIAVIYNLFTALGQIDIETFFSYFDYYVNSARFYQAYFDGSLPLFHGKIFLTDFWSLVPRGIYPDKPFVYGFLHVNEFFYPGEAARTNTPAFGGPTKAFADFGIVGVIISSLFNLPFVFSLFFMNCLFVYGNIFIHKFNSSYIFLFIICFSPTFLSFIPITLGIVLCLLLLFFIMVFSRITWRSKVI
jgi:hypothetical protein